MSEAVVRRKPLRLFKVMRGEMVPAGKNLPIGAKFTHGCCELAATKDVFVEATGHYE